MRNLSSSIIYSKIYVTDKGKSDLLKGDEMKKTIGLTLAALMFGAVFLGALSINVSADAELPVWQVGDGWWFENTVDFSELQQEIDAGMAELPPGFNADITVGGGIGIYFGVEVVDTAYEYNGYNCYKVDFTGAVGIDFGLEASVNGEITEELLSLEIDATGQLVIVGEANLVGSLYFTVDELALAGGDFTLTVEATGDLLVDAYINIFMDTSGFGGQVISEEANIDVDASVAVENVLITGSLELDPPIDFLDFPIFEGDEWEVPEQDTDWIASLVGSGTITVDADVTGIPEQPPIHEHEVIDLGVEIGTNTESGVFDNFYARGLRCVAVYGDNYIIETDIGNFFNYYDWGTRQYGIDPLDYVGDVIPSSAGVQYSASEGFITGVTVDGEVMTEASDKASVEGAAADPLGKVQEETGGHGSVGERGGIFTLLLIGIIVIVLVLVLVAVIAGRRKKQGPEEMYGAQQPQQTAYQQPPPPPPPEQETVVQDDQTLVEDDQTLVE